MPLDKYNGKVDAVFRPKKMSARELEHSVAWFAKKFYSFPSIFDRLVLKSRVGLWWNVPRNLGYRAALFWRDGVDFKQLSPSLTAERPFADTEEADNSLNISDC